ncbi:DUF2007 domain-containing protein [Aquimarina hainanensis]|uniref:DUF2007 domain-containing protein n=1 Tax=Aquimarina hainanensis TaxID=1578017 RepID=A0ABW5N223_9FLAO|nr:DUF2007 domain-containing protein [Aquimarina sp. TRL1]QKX04677.1 DUF2007 domain-containing protein [Aquimarina sp. TRL1]
MKDYVIIATFTFQHEYTVLKLLLDREGIDYFFENEITNSVLPFHTNLIAGINLKVHRRDQEKAEQIIRDFNTNSHLRIV